MKIVTKAKPMNLLNDHWDFFLCSLRTSPCPTGSSPTHRSGTPSKSLPQMENAQAQAFPRSVSVSEAAVFAKEYE